MGKQWRPPEQSDGRFKGIPYLSKELAKELAKERANRS